LKSGGRVIAFAAPLVAAAACAGLVDLEEVRYVSPADAAPDGEGEADRGAPDVAADGATPSPGMVHVGTPPEDFDIDVAEVTYREYRAFLLVDAGPQAPECASNETFAPAVGGADDEPVAGIDWCDARAYCAWLGKRLCGRIVGGVTSALTSLAQARDVSHAEWSIACTHAGQRTYPYGDTYERGACNEIDAGAGQRAPAGRFPACEGGYPGMFDMLGNVWEFIDYCDLTDAGRVCYFQGGSYLSTATPSCGEIGSAAQDFWNVDVGLRCCSR
jgi:formylglycine-generating enzyme required for sulfatase activity